MPTVVSVLNQKGGSGKSTLTTNLARAFEMEGHSAEILDGDSQRTVTEWGKLASEAMPTVTPTTAPTIEEDMEAASSSVVFIDGAPAHDTLNVRAMKLSDLVLIPVRTSGPDVWSSEDLLGSIQTRRDQTGEPRAAFVVSQQIARTNLASEIGDVLDTYSLPTLEERTNHRIAYAEALSSGTTVLDMPGAKKAQDEILRITEQSLQLLRQSNE
ncbi:ParA family partition ATPase [Salinibacter ruber]|jgi:chromosome partitioning protein|uniref:ParA family partition ATPase n=1 Tax=Salinibacter ruber TaxID=146919 RepID=UPI00216A4A23|nr:ParA family partition ATPase [Salinibacter ruber]MCS4201744.1 chromosome partitioning protein [Salinibacter ruber]